mmetsp:Transcript_16541/g.34116  ORF Transcript_16541/g.34116 Transcript_16541/m.34116 type:complete len:251 (-) Transcript_16541:82-834(-)
MRTQIKLVAVLIGSRSSIPATQQNPRTPDTARALLISEPLSSVGMSGKLAKRSPLVLVTPSGHGTLELVMVGNCVMSRCKSPYCETLPFFADKLMTFAIVLESLEAAAASTKAIKERLPAFTLRAFISSKRLMGSSSMTVISSPESDGSSRILAQSPVKTASYWSLSSRFEKADASCDCKEEPAATNPSIIPSFSSIACSLVERIVWGVGARKAPASLKASISITDWTIMIDTLIINFQEPLICVRWIGN